MGNIIPNWREGNLRSLADKQDKQPSSRLDAIADAWHTSGAIAWASCSFSTDGRTVELVPTDISYRQAVPYQVGSWGRCEGFFCLCQMMITLFYSMTASVTEKLGSIVWVSADEFMVRCQVFVIKMRQLWYLLRFISRGVCFGGIWSLFSLTCNIRIQNIAEGFKENSIFSSVWPFLLLLFCFLFGVK